MEGSDIGYNLIFNFCKSLVRVFYVIFFILGLGSLFLLFLSAFNVFFFFFLVQIRFLLWLGIN